MPAQTSLPIHSNGSVTLKPNGSVPLVDPTAADCCCEEPTCTDFIALNQILQNGGSHGGPGYPGFPVRAHPFYNQKKCHRLFAWERRVYTAAGAVWSGPDAADWILKTSERGARAIAGGPFETTPASGILLEDEPYWWPCLGGWEEVASMWYEPVLSQVLPYIVPPFAPVDGTTYTILAIVRYNHWTDEVVNGSGVIIPVTSGQVKLITMSVVTY